MSQQDTRPHVTQRSAERTIPALLPETVRGEKLWLPRFQRDTIAGSANAVLSPPPAPPHVQRLGRVVAEDVSRRSSFLPAALCWESRGPENTSSNTELRGGEPQALHDFGLNRFVLLASVRLPERGLSKPLCTCELFTSGPTRTLRSCRSRFTNVHFCLF